MDEHLPFDDKAFSGQLPLFPLPNVVLLPGGLMSLHVFEERYRIMVREALEGERLIGMAILKPGYEANYGGKPEIYDYACLGEITKEQELPGGRFLITLRGLRRARILREAAEDAANKPYRIAEVKIPRDLPGTLEVELLRLRQLIAQTAIRLPDTKLPSNRELRQLLTAPPEVVANALYFDLVAAVSPLEIDERRRVLEGDTLCERAHIIIASLTRTIIESRPASFSSELSPSQN